MSDESEADVAAIREVIARQFANISWSQEQQPDWAAFEADFLPGAVLCPASRPVRPKSVEVFVERMKGVAADKVESLRETLLGAEIRVFGNVAIAMATCGMVENGGDPQRGVEAILLVREDGLWRIAAQAWDMERPGLTVPTTLLDAG